LQLHEHVPDQHLQSDQLLGGRQLRTQPLMAVRCMSFARLLCAILLLTTVPLVVACGSSSTASSTTTPSGRSERDAVTNGTITHRPLDGTGGEEVNDDNPGKADRGNKPAGAQSNPCALVPTAEARAIVGGPITAQEAPLGPTCIYRAAGSKSFVTLAVESVSLASLLPHLRDHKRIAVHGRTGYCGIYGQSMTFVPLGRGHVLNVTAPCGVGRMFAAKALSRLKT
ncbi:MAG TPA: hypothetical protein VEW91_11010, partial [bacterium]|nr:hypothetical protein [bacterium]